MYTMNCYDTPGEYNPPNNAFYTQVPVPDTLNTAVFIGKDGCYLKLTTERSGCDYLWYDTDRRVVEVWGHRESALPRAVELLTKRIARLAARDQQ